MLMYVRGLGLGRTVIRCRRMYVCTYGICRIIEKPRSVCFFSAPFPAYMKRDFEASFLRKSDILCHFRVYLLYLIRILAYFNTYVGILRKIHALYGCIRILRRIIRNTLTYRGYATATAYNWLNIRVWT
jgi:hypothetical protein